MRINCVVLIMKGNVGKNMFFFKVILFEVFKVFFGKFMKRGNIFCDKIIKVFFGLKKNII